MSDSHPRVRPARFADNMWYSSSPPQLERDVQGYLTAAPPGPGPVDLIGLVAPHAGYFFSGAVAGAAFASLAPGTFDSVVLLGPDHHGAAFGKTSTPRVGAWRTPLGEIPVAWELLEALQAEIELRLLPIDDEHSLEIELPFLQVRLGQFRLVPLMMGDQGLTTCQALAEAIVKAAGGVEGKVLLVASSDLSHYFDDETARDLDRTTLAYILAMDGDGLIQHVEAGRRRGDPLACGAGPIATVIHAAKRLGATQAHLVKYATSADAHPRKDRVVGYAAVAIGRG